MTTPEFLSLLLAALAKVIPGYAEMNDAGRKTALSMAHSLFEAFQPTDALEAARAAHAVAASLAAMDSFARAAKPDVSDEKVVRLRSNALAAGRVFDAAVRASRPEQQRPSRDQARPRAASPRPHIVPASQVRHRAEPSLPLAVLADTAPQASRRSDWRHSTALTALQPTVLPFDQGAVS
jgi:hypothetical protein